MVQNNDVREKVMVRAHMSVCEGTINFVSTFKCDKKYILVLRIPPDNDFTVVTLLLHVMSELG